MEKDNSKKNKHCHPYPFMPNQPNEDDDSSSSTPRNEQQNGQNPIDFDSFNHSMNNPSQVTTQLCPSTIPTLSSRMEALRLSNNPPQATRQLSPSTIRALSSSMEALNLLNNPYNNNNSYTLGGGSYPGLRNLVGTTSSGMVDEAYLNRMRFARAVATARVHGIHDDRAVAYENLHAMRGRLVFEAKDPCGCRWLQKKIDEGTPQEVKFILVDLKDHLHELMKHPFGNYVVQKLFLTTNASMAMVDAIINLIIRDVRMLKDVCMDDQGNRVIQKMVEKITNSPNRLRAFMNAMKRIVVALMKNQNGGYVIQQCVRLFPLEYKKDILDEVARDCVDIARDRSGCCVIQKCLVLGAEGETIFQLVWEIVSNVQVLAQDPYGNYVVQFLVKMNIQPVNENVIYQLRGKYVELSMNKYASNVVEDLIQYSEVKKGAMIVVELMESDQFLSVLQNPFGNYVAQKALQYIKGTTLHRIFCNRILSMHAYLHSHLYGKRVLAFAKASRFRV